MIQLYSVALGSFFMASPTTGSTDPRPALHSPVAHRSLRAQAGLFFFNKIAMPYETFRSRKNVWN